MEWKWVEFNKTGFSFIPVSYMWPTMTFFAQMKYYIICGKLLYNDKLKKTWKIMHLFDNWLSLYVVLINQTLTENLNQFYSNLKDIIFVKIFSLLYVVKYRVNIQIVELLREKNDFRCKRKQISSPKYGKSEKYCVTTFCSLHNFQI